MDVMKLRSEDEEGMKGGVGMIKTLKVHEEGGPVLCHLRTAGYQPWEVKQD